MMWLSIIGAFCFGLVVGWVTYRSLRHSLSNGINDIAAVIGAVGGAAVTALFPQGTGAFGSYCIGLAIGFFGYLVTAVVLARRIGKLEGNEAKNLAGVAEWLGEPPKVPGSNGPTNEQQAPDSGGLRTPTRTAGANRSPADADLSN